MKSLFAVAFAATFAAAVSGAVDYASCVRPFCGAEGEGNTFGAEAEMTATEHVGVFRFRWSGPGAKLLVDAEHFGGANAAVRKTAFDGVELAGPRIPHERLAAGGELVFTMGE